MRDCFKSSLLHPKRINGCQIFKEACIDQYIVRKVVEINGRKRKKEHCVVVNHCLESDFDSIELQTDSTVHSPQFTMSF